MSTVVGKAIGFLDLDFSNFVKGLKKAKQESQQTMMSLKDSLDVMGTSFKTVGDAMSGIGDKMTAAITVPVMGALTTAVKQYADYEQAVGGIETMFKQSADSVIKNSETAYFRAGISGTKYMEQLTSFSASLLQGLGGDTVKAGKLADIAMVDMSDNANKFGTNIESIQDAYQGFAKGNFQMLDNLKLGYGGTASEMARLINDSGVLGDSFKATSKNVSDIPFHTMIEAIHEIQTEMGVTGTTSIEATETISGSFGMAKASVEDFLAGLGNANADIPQLVENMLSSIKYFVDNVKNTLLTIWDNLPLSPFQKWAGAIVVAAGPILSLTGRMVSGAGNMMHAWNTWVEFKPKLAGSFTTLKTTMMGFVSGPVIAIIAGIGLLVLAFVDLWKNNEHFREAITNIWLNIQTSFEDFVYQIKERLNNLGIEFESFGELLRKIWTAITDFLAPVFITAFESIEIIIDTVLETILDTFDLFVAIFKGDWETAWEEVKSIVSNILNGLGGIFKSTMDLAYNIILNGWYLIYDYITKTLTNLIGGTTESFDQILYHIQMAMESVWIVIETVWVYITESFQNAIDFIKAIIDGDWAAAWETMKAQWELVKETFSEIWLQIQEIFFNVIDAIVLFFSEKFDEFKEYISNWASDTWTAITEWFEQLPGYLKEKWDQIVADVTEWGTNMWEKAKETGSNFLDSVVEFFEQLPYQIGLFLGKAIGNTILWAIDMWNKAKETGTKFIENITIFFQQLPGKIEKWLKDTWNKTTKWASDTWEKGKEAGRKFVDNTIEFFKQLPGKVKQWLDDTIEKLKTWVKNMGNKGKEAGDDVTKKTTEAVKALPGKMTDAGKEVVNGFWQGIKNMGTTLKNNVTGFFTGIVDGVKSTLGIKSPSRVFMAIGEPSAEGYGVGFINMFGSVMKNIQKTMNKGIDNLDVKPVKVDIEEGNTELTNSIDNSAYGMFEGILDIFLNIEDKITDSIDRTKEELRRMATGINSPIEYLLAYQASSVGNATVYQTNEQSISKTKEDENTIIKELNETITELKDEVSKIKDIQIETIVNLDNKEIARAQRDPIDNELALKQKDNNQWRGRKD